MPYQHLQWEDVQNTRLREVFEHADAYLHDVYGMFPERKPDEGGGCNFSASLILLCVIDSLANKVWPRRPAVRPTARPARGFCRLVGCTPRQRRNQEQQFTTLVREKLYWGPQQLGWTEKRRAAKIMYLELRNPLIHGLAEDTVSRARPGGFKEPMIGKWGRIPEPHDISRIDALSTWDDNWPTMEPQGDRPDGPRMKLCLAGLYWGVKRITLDLLADVKAGRIQ